MRRGVSRSRVSTLKMKIYSATATSDWGYIFADERIKASSFATAIARAARLAKQRGKKRPKQITIKCIFVGNDDASYLGLPADEDTPERPL